MSEVRDYGLTQEQLREDLHYDAATGVFVRLRASSRRVHVGDIAGYCDGKGYRSIAVRGRAYRSSHLAWLYVHGVWPDGIIDHINTDPSDDRIENLRDIPFRGNAQNQRRAHKHNGSGVLGVERLSSGRYRPRINVAGRYVHLGVYDTPEEASAVYWAAKKRMHPYSVTP